MGQKGKGHLKQKMYYSKSEKNKNRKCRINISNSGGFMKIKDQELLKSKNKLRDFVNRLNSSAA